MILTSLGIALTLLLFGGSPPQQAPWFRLEFFEAADGKSFDFGISEPAYVAVFTVHMGRASLIYPAVGDDLRKLRFGERKTLPEPANLYKPGRHLLPRGAGQVWTANSTNITMMKGPHILVLASRRQFHFEKLNSLYEGEGPGLRKHNSMGVVKDMPQLLMRTIVPEYTAKDWDFYLHWIR